MLKQFLLYMKDNKLQIAFIFFTLIYFLAAGEDVPWIGIIITSPIYGAITTALFYLIYKLFSLLAKIVHS